MNLMQKLLELEYLFQQGDKVTAIPNLKTFRDEYQDNEDFYENYKAEFLDEGDDE